MDVGGIIRAITTVLTFAIIGRAILSWFPDMQNSSLGRLLYNFTEPILAPFRQVIPMVGSFDISPIVAIIVIQVIGGVLASLL